MAEVLIWPQLVGGEQNGAAVGTDWRGVHRSPREVSGDDRYIERKAVEYYSEVMMQLVPGELAVRMLVVQTREDGSPMSQREREVLASRVIATPFTIMLKGLS